MAMIPAPKNTSAAPATGSAVHALAHSTVAAVASHAKGAFFVLPADVPAIAFDGDDSASDMGVAAMDAPKSKSKGPAKPSKPVKATPGKKPASSAAPKPNTTVGKPPSKPKPKPVPNMAPGKHDPVALKGSGSANSASTGEVGSPDVAYAFTIDIEGTEYGMFSEIGGISWKAEPIPVRSGGNNEYSLNMRGPGKFEPLTLKRGWFASNSEFFQLLKQGLGGSIPPTAKAAGRFALTIHCMDRKYKRIGSYNFSNCFFVEYTGPGFNSMSGQVGFEQIRVAYDYFTYIASGG
ncbi:MAG: phage tail protein [Deltaproteobacteria bacterium]|nr:phage tail protein [Deltaproteobacteria bacterium]